MRTDVKLGVVFALVMVLAAGGYFMFRGEKQTPIPIAEQGMGSDAKHEPGKPGTAKPLVGQPRNPVANNNRPSASPKPVAGNMNVTSRPASPVATPALNKPAVTPPASSATTDASANPATPRPTNPTPSNTPPGGSNPAAPAVTPMGLANANPAVTPVVEKPIPAATTPTASTGSPATPTVVAERPATPASGMPVSLTGMPNPATPPAANTNAPRPNPAGTMTPLTNSPSASAPPASPSVSPAAIPNTSSALPPGIQTANSPKSDANSARKSGPASAAVETHKVQVGDSFSSLAQAYYGDPKYAKILADANPKLSDPKNLKVGTLVNIPPLPTDADLRTNGSASTASTAKPGDKPSANGSRTYTVKAGDSFYSIAKSQLGNANRWKELLALNNATVKGDPTALQPGQRLVLPESH